MSYASGSGQRPASASASNALRADLEQTRRVLGGRAGPLPRDRVQHRAHEQWVAAGGRLQRGAEGLVRLEAVQLARQHQRALDTAAQLAERSQQDQDEGPGRYCTPAYVEIQRAATWIELGRPERAIDLFEDSLARLPSVHRRDRGVYLARLASAYALSGSPDTSVPMGWEAVTVAQATGSRRISTELGQLGRRLTRWQSMPEVAQLRKELPAA